MGKRTNEIESFWAMFRRGYHGTYHHMSEKHLGRYVDEFAGRHNIRTGNIRDFICDSCNTGLGRFKNGENYLLNAIQYLKERENDR